MSPSKRDQVPCERFRFGARKKREGASPTFLEYGGVWTAEELIPISAGYESTMPLKSRVEIYGHRVWHE